MTAKVLFATSLVFFFASFFSSRKAYACWRTEHLPDARMWAREILIDEAAGDPIGVDGHRLHRLNVEDSWAFA